MTKPIDAPDALERVRAWAALQDMHGVSTIEPADPSENDTLTNATDCFLFRVKWPEPGDAFPTSHYVTIDRVTGDVAPLIPPGLPG